MRPSMIIYLPPARVTHRAPKTKLGPDLLSHKHLRSSTCPPPNSLPAPSPCSARYIPTMRRLSIPVKTVYRIFFPKSSHPLRTRCSFNPSSDTPNNGRQCFPHPHRCFPPRVGSHEYLLSLPLFTQYHINIHRAPTVCKTSFLALSMPQRLRQTPQWRETE